MQLSNTPHSFGLISILLHWSMALLVLILIPLGLWMTELDYYHAWYKKGPDLHRSLGILVAFLLLLRLFWRAFNPSPAMPAATPAWQRRSAHRVHQGLLLLGGLLVISGYLISTADGRGVALFNWLEIPALGISVEHQEDIAGEVHFWLAMVMIGLLVLHLGAALHHQFIERSGLLLRMLIPGRRLSKDH